MILESIVTTLDEDGAVHIAPMGPDVSDGFDHFVLRPFQTSRTFANLQRTRQGVLHVTDDVELMARAAIGRFDETPAAPAGTGHPGADSGRRVSLVRLRGGIHGRSRAAGGAPLSRGRRGQAARFPRLQSGQARGGRGGHPGHASRTAAGQYRAE